MTEEECIDEIDQILRAAYDEDPSDDLAIARAAYMLGARPPGARAPSRLAAFLAELEGPIQKCDICGWPLATMHTPMGDDTVCWRITNTCGGQLTSAGTEQCLLRAGENVRRAREGSANE